MMQNFDLKYFLIGLIVIVCSITLHEFGHAISAYKLGDDTPRRDGRITLWPDKHFDPLGFLMIVLTMLTGFGLGWGRPVMVDPRNFRHPRRDMIIVALCGPLMNLLLAVIAGLILRVALHGEGTAWLTGVPEQFVWSFLIINLSLMFFNLIPIPPLDGSKILAGLLPYDLAFRYQRLMDQWGMVLLILLLVTRSVGHITQPAVMSTIHLLLGLPGGGL